MKGKTPQAPKGQKGPEVPIIPGVAGMTPSQYNSPAYHGVYRIFDTDLARDNLENDIPAADLEDL